MPGPAQLRGVQLGGVRHCPLALWAGRLGSKALSYCGPSWSWANGNWVTLLFISDHRQGWAESDQANYGTMHGNAAASSFQHGHFVELMPDACHCMCMVCHHHLPTPTSVLPAFLDGLAVGPALRWATFPCRHHPQLPASLPVTQHGNRTSSEGAQYPCFITPFLPPLPIPRCCCREFCLGNVVFECAEGTVCTGSKNGQSPCTFATSGKTPCPGEFDDYACCSSKHYCLRGVQVACGAGKRCLGAKAPGGHPCHDIVVREGDCDECEPVVKCETDCDKPVPVPAPPPPPTCPKGDWQCTSDT